MNIIRIPKDRIGALIGPGGETRRLLIERSGIPFEVDSQENEVTLHDEQPGVDAIMALKMRDIVKAIGRGFSPESAMRLFSDEAYFELIDINEFTGKNRERQRQVTARLIGTDGKTRRILEEQTGCAFAIYGHTVGIIGGIEEIVIAKQAVEMILGGAEHATAYRFLENQRRKAKRAGNELWET
jgi:ribosomal RNA assembly protein